MARESSKSRHRPPPHKESSGPSTVTIRGWTILAHPLFIDQINNLVEAAERELERGGSRANTKLLAHLLDLAFDKIPRNPSDPQYRQGTTLGEDYKHWFRAKTGGGRYRLFFRYSSSARAILYAWVNDDQSLRTYGKSDDAYAVFARMLAKGNPPDDWDALVRAASKQSVSTALKRFAQRVTGRGQDFS